MASKDMMVPEEPGDANKERANPFGIEDEELDNVYWPPGAGNPADSLTKIKSEMGAILSLLGTGRFQPGVLRPLRGLASRE